MKIKTFLFAAAALILAASCSRGYQVSGHLDGLQGDTLQVSVYDIAAAALDRADLIPVTDGNFAFNVADDQATEIIIMDKAAGYQGGIIQFMVVPGENAVISGTLQDYTISGSKYYQDVDEYTTLTAPLQKEFDEYYQAARKKMEEHPELQEELSEEYAAKAEEVTEKVMQIGAEFIEQHPNSLQSVLLACQQDDIEAWIEKLPAKNINGVMKSFVEASRKAAEAERVRKEAEERIKEGAEAPDFTLPTPDGTSLSLSSPRGKYVMLDFWGSWCHWCIVGIPNLKEIYALQSDKVEFLSIACRDTEKKWRDALEKYELPWLQALNDGDVDVSALYAVQGYPSFILIDPEGKIEKIWLGESEEFIEYMKAL